MLERTLRWRPLTGSGLEHVRVREEPDAVRATGALIAEDGGIRFAAFYDLLLSPDWSFRSILIRDALGRTLQLARDASGHWSDTEGERPDLAACLDIDLSGSPLTNTLPIRRARWETGVPQRFTMAWIDLVAFTVQPDGQIYTPLAPDRFRYEAADGSFHAELTVDSDGFVTHYPPLFTAA